MAPMGEKLHASYKNVSRTYIVMISATLLHNTTVIKCIPEVNRNKANSFHFVQQLIQCSYPVIRYLPGYFEIFYCNDMFNSFRVLFLYQYSFVSCLLLIKLHQL